MAGYKDVTVIIFDVGKNAGDRDSKTGSTFFEQELECVQKILLRKLFTKPKDEVSLLLMGTTVTNNPLSEKLGGYEHISEGFPMAVSNWNMLKYFENSVDPPNETINGDWLDAIVVAMDSLMELNATKSNLKIILFATFSTELINAQETVDSIIKGLKDNGIELIVITTNIEYVLSNESEEDTPIFSQAVQKSGIRKENETFISRIIDETSGTLCSFKEAIQQLIYFDKKQRRRIPWKCDLQIGSNIAIKIAAYIYIREEKELGPWKVRGSKGEKCQSKIEYYHQDEVLDPETVEENLTKGYMYGQTAVPYDQGVKYDGGPKSFRCIGFVDQSDIKDHNLAGTGVWVVIGQKESSVAEKMITALVASMRNSNLAMIVRYVYSRVAKPKMMALFPNGHNKKYPNHNSLLMYELLYKENYVQVTFPSLQTKKTEPTAEQYEAVDKLIDSMDLMDVIDNAQFENAGVDDDDDMEERQGSEAFKRLLNPGLQHMYRAIAHRALHPKEPVLSADKDLLEMLNPPKEVQVKSKPHVERIKELFPLEVVKKSTKTALFEKLQKISGNVDPDADDNLLMAPSHDGNVNLVEVGTVSPAEDFLELLRRGERYPALATQLQKVINDIVLKSMVLPVEKVLKAILVYREEAKRLGPHKYNEWVQEFKHLLIQRNKEDIWVKLIQVEGFGLITSKESEMSLVTEEEAAAFYMSGFGTTDVSKNMAADDDQNVEDLFEDM